MKDTFHIAHPALIKPAYTWKPSYVITIIIQKKKLRFNALNSEDFS